MWKTDMLCFDESTIFQSLSNNQLSFEEVFEQIISFIKADTNCSYRISIGTDSNVYKKTVFVSCIHVHRIGRGAIGFLHKTQIDRRIVSLREKIYLETLASMQLAYLFDEQKMKKIHDTIAYNGKFNEVFFEFHIDVGKKGKTRSLINEMVKMTTGLNFVPKIKPDSYCASSFADRYTKAM